MPNKYDKPTVEAIWTLMCHDVKPTEISRRLAADEAGIGYEVPMPLPTVKYYCRKLRQERGEPVAEIKPEERLEAAHAIECRALEYLRREQLRLETKAKTGEPTRADIAKSIAIAKATAELGKPRATKSERHSNSAKAKPVSSGSFLSGLSRQLETPSLDHSAREDHAEGEETEPTRDDQARALDHVGVSTEPDSTEADAETVPHPRKPGAEPVPSPA